MSNALSPVLETVLAGLHCGNVTHLASALQPLGRPQIILLAVGICVLVAWVIRRLAYPTKLKLRQCPGHPNNLTPAHILMLLAVWIGASAGLNEMLKLLAAENVPGAKLLAFSIAQVIFLAGSLAVAATTFRVGLVRGLGLSVRHWPWDLVRGIVGYLIVFPVSTGLLYATSRFVPAQEHELLTTIKSASPGWPLMLGIVSAVVLAPLTEEVFFRGLCQSMVQNYGRPWPAILVAAAFFALVHLAYPHSMPAMFALGVVLGYNYARSGRLLAPILIHAIFNAVGVIFAMTGQ